MSSSIFEKISTEAINSWTEFLTLALPPLTIVMVIVGLPLILCKKCRSNLSMEKGILLFGFCLIGLVPGILAGYSQQAIAGTFLTATIGIVSALLSFGFAKDSLAEWRPVIPIAMILTLFGALAGFSSGGVAKNRWIVFDQQVQQTKFANEQIRGPVELARRKFNLERLVEAKKANQANGESSYISVAELTEVNEPQSDVGNVE